MKIKHSKYKNAGILFELLVRQITCDTLEGRKSPVNELLQKYFLKTELGKEYKLYETLLKKTSLTESRADIVITSLVESSKTLNRRLLKKQKYNLINELKRHYNLQEFFNHKLPHYKVHAAFYTLIEAYNADTPPTPDLIINNKLTILEHLSAAKIPIKKVEDDVLNELNADKDLQILTYRIMLEKFNEKYDDLSKTQKEILKELLSSIDNQPKLQEFYTNKSNEIKKDLISLNKKVTDKVTQIKINEIIKLVTPKKTKSKVTDESLVNLLQYCDLVNELETVNG